MTKEPPKRPTSGPDEPTGEVVDFREAREKKIEEKRRKTERILFKQMLGIYCVTGNDEFRQLEIMDVSEDGLSFQIPFDAENPWPKDQADIPIRFYFSQDTYLPVNVAVQNSTPVIEEGQRFLRFGCTIDKDFASYQAFLQFVRFLKSYSEHAHKDMGDMTLFYL